VTALRAACAQSGLVVLAAPSVEDFRVVGNRQRPAEPEPTKSESRLESARLARIFQVSTAEKDRLSTSD
jgi:hypothetical protein